jgi:hypothetical protein
MELFIQRKKQGYPVMCGDQLQCGVDGSPLHVGIFLEHSWSTVMHSRASTGRAKWEEVVVA